MSDVSQGPGWWLASDGKWYPPEQAPGQAPTAQAPAQGPAAQAPSAAPGAAPTGAYPAGGYPSTYGPGPVPGPLASWGTRVLATLIDGAISTVLVIAGVILALIVGAISSVLGLLIAAAVYLVSIALGFYFTYMTGACGQSPGKKIMGIRVVSEETGQVIGGGMGIVRGLAHFVDGIIFGVGFLFPLWDEKRQTLADKIMKTVVLSDAPKHKVSAELLKV